MEKVTLLFYTTLLLLLRFSLLHSKVCIEQVAELYWPLNVSFRAQARKYAHDGFVLIDVTMAAVLAELRVFTLLFDVVRRVGQGGSRPEFATGRHDGSRQPATSAPSRHLVGRDWLFLLGRSEGSDVIGRRLQGSQGGRAALLPASRRRRQTGQMRLIGILIAQATQTTEGLKDRIG